MTEAPLQLATWNIHMGIGQDGRRDMRRTAEVIRRINPDLIGLQEVDNHVHLSGSDLHTLQDLSGLEAVPGPTMQRAGGDYGNALLSRLPVLEVERFDLSTGRQREPRGLLIAHLDWQGETLQAAVTHLGLSPGERRSQVRRLIDTLAGTERRPLILMGDFNEWFVWGRPRRWLKAHFGPLQPLATFPSRRPLFSLDQILADPPERLHKLRTVTFDLARQASDHLPLSALFDGRAR